MNVESKTSIEDLSIVCNFLEVLQKDIYNLSPEWEVKFSIDLVPDTRLISMASCIIYEVELSEIKKQLYEHLEKHSVRPNVSLWGVTKLLAKKKDETMRLCVDYRQLKTDTIKN